MKTKKGKKMLFVFLAAVGVVLLLVLGTNGYTVLSTRGKLFSMKEKERIPAADAILVLGAGVRADGTPTPMLADRLLTALSLFDAGVSDAIIVSGDHGNEDYNEVGAMKAFLTERGVPSERIFQDHEGFSTYDSLFRAASVFGAESLVVVTQEYHAYRALMIGRHLDLECSAVAAPILSTTAQAYAGQGWYSAREIAARTKDFFASLFSPKPKESAESISLSGNGDNTDRL